MIVQFILQLLGCAGLFLMGVFFTVYIVSEAFTEAAHSGEELRIGDFDIKVSLKKGKDQ